MRCFHYVFVIRTQCRSATTCTIWSTSADIFSICRRFWIFWLWERSCWLLFALSVFWYRQLWKKKKKLLRVPLWLKHSNNYILKSILLSIWSGAKVLNSIKVIVLFQNYDVSATCIVDLSRHFISYLYKNNYTILVKYCNYKK